MGILNQDRFRILAFSDYRLHCLDLLEEKIDELGLKIDIILYGGDDTCRFVKKNDDDKIIINHFERLAKKAKYGLGAIIGNDCNKKDFHLIKGKKVTDLHRKQISIGKYTIIGFEGAETNDENEGIGPTLYKREYIKRRLSSIIKKYQRKTIILVTHSPPYRLLDFSVRFGKQNIGSKAIREIIENNENILLDICGHSHMNGGKSGKLNKCVILNVSNHDNKKNRVFPMGRFCLIDVNKNNVDYKWHFVEKEKREYLKTKPLTTYFNKS